MRPVPISALVFSFCACASHDSSASAEDAHRAQDAFVYAAVIDSGYPRKPTARVSVLERTSAPRLLPGLTIDSMLTFFAGEAPGVTADMVRAVFRKTGERLSIRAALLDRPNVVWMDSTAFVGAKLDWRHAVVGLSPIAYRADGRQALVALSVSCGPLCGDQDFIVLERLEPHRLHVAKYIAFLKS